MRRTRLRALVRPERAVKGRDDESLKERGSGRCVGCRCYIYSYSNGK